MAGNPTDTGNGSSAVERPNMICKHYERIALKGRKAANLMFCLESAVGDLSLETAFRLYMNQVDPFLTSGCELSPDPSKTLLRKPQSIQESFLRRALH